MSTGASASVAAVLSGAKSVIERPEIFDAKWRPHGQAGYPLGEDSPVDSHDPGDAGGAGGRRGSGAIRVTDHDVGGLLDATSRTHS